MFKRMSKGKKIFIILDFIAYIALAIVLIVESSLDGTRSASHSNAVGGTIADVVDNINGDTSETILPTSLSITNKMSEANIGDIYQLNTLVEPEDATYKEVIFESSNSSVATVTDSGNVTFINAGDVTLTAKNKNYKDQFDTVDIHVHEILATSIQSEIYDKDNNEPAIKQDDIYLLELGKSYQIKTTIEPDNVTNKTVAYSADDLTYLSLTSDTIYPKKISNDEITTINSTCGELTYSLKVTVIQYIGYVELESISAANTINLSLNNTYSSSNLISKADISFNPVDSSDKNLAIDISESQRIEKKESNYFANSVGADQIKVYSLDFSEIYTFVNVNITEKDLNSFKIQLNSSTNVRLAKNSSGTVKVSSISPSDSSINSSNFFNNAILYSSDQSILKITNNKGGVKALANGEVDLICHAKKNSSDEDYSITSNTIHVTVYTPEQTPEFNSEVNNYSLNIIDEHNETLENSEILHYYYLNKQYSLTSIIKIDKFFKDDVQITTNVSDKTLSYKVTDLLGEDLSSSLINGNYFTPNSITNLNFVVTHKKTSISKSISLSIVPNISKITVNNEVFSETSSAFSFNDYELNHGFKINSKVNNLLNIEINELDECLELVEISLSILNPNDITVVQEISKTNKSIKIETTEEGQAKILISLNIYGISYDFLSRIIYVNVTHELANDFTFNLYEIKDEKKILDVKYIMDNLYEIVLYRNQAVYLETLVNESVTKSRFSYEINNKGILDINQDNKLLLNKAGAAKLIIKENEANISKEIRIIVKNLIGINENQAYSITGQYQHYDNETKIYHLTNNYSYTLKTYFTEETTYKETEFSSSDDEVLSVSNAGIITCRKIGTATITAKVNDGITELKLYEINVSVDPKSAIDNLQTFLSKVRKLVGHFGAFLIFGIFSALFWVLAFDKQKWRFSIPIAFINGILLAMLTEWIQLYVPGRGGSWKDVAIDSNGFLISTSIITVVVLLVYLIIYLVKKKKRKVVNDSSVHIIDEKEFLISNKTSSIETTDEKTNKKT